MMAKDYGDELREAPRLPATRDLTGQVFDMLTVIEFAGYIEKHAAWWVECECGTRFVRRASSLVHYHDYRTKPRTNPQNCGCLRTNVATKYGKSLYNTWNKLKLRQALCREWKHDFDAFASTVGKRQGRFLTRPDLSKPMGPENYVWSDEIKHRGVTEAAKRLGITRQGLYYRLRQYSTEEALNCPKRNLPETSVKPELNSAITSENSDSTPMLESATTS